VHVAAARSSGDADAVAGLLRAAWGAVAWTLARALEGTRNAAAYVETLRVQGELCAAGRPGARVVDARRRTWDAWRDVE
jgi:hypothetical protein